MKYRKQKYNSILFDIALLFFSTLVWSFITLGIIAADISCKIFEWTYKKLNK